MPRKVLRRRKRQRRKEIRPLIDELEASVGAAPLSHEDQVDRAQGGDLDVLLVEGTPLALIVQGEPFPTVRGLLKNPVTRRYVTVDMGAVPHVTNGADVMSPGVVDADPDIEEGHMVWVRDERNMMPLAVGRALLPGPQMVVDDHGKAVRTIHHVGDWLWAIGEG